MRLFELFNTNVTWTKQHSEDGDPEFTANINGSIVTISYDKQLFNNKNSVSIHFSRDGDTRETGQGNASIIFGAVINHIKQWVDKNNPEQILFTASTIDTDSRSDLYKKMVKRYAAQAGYTYDVKNSIIKDIFILNKNH